MKGTPKPAVDPGAALANANRLTESSEMPSEERPEHEENKYVNLRFKETDYIRLKKTFGGQGFNMTSGCRKAAVYVAELIQQGVLTMTEGGIFKKG
jgi:hypothetical protein